MGDLMKKRKEYKTYCDNETYNTFIRRETAKLSKQTLDNKDVTALDVLIENMRLQKMNNAFSDMNTFNLLVKKINSNRKK